MLRQDARPGKGLLAGLLILILQDTLTPAGYETPEANRYYRWDAALDLAGNRQPRARGVARNGALLETWGPLLAASHKRADFGLVDPRGALAGPQKGLGREDILRRPVRTTRRIPIVCGTLCCRPSSGNCARQRIAASNKERKR